MESHVDIVHLRTHFALKVCDILGEHSMYLYRVLYICELISKHFVCLLTISYLHPYIYPHIFAYFLMCVFSILAYFYSCIYCRRASIYEEERVVNFFLRFCISPNTMLINPIRFLVTPLPIQFLVNIAISFFFFSAEEHSILYM